MPPRGHLNAHITVKEVPRMHGALAGIRILEFSQIVAGPYTGLVLSDFGADVVKVEPPEGESRRNSGAVVPNEGKYFQSLNRGKRSLTCDLADPRGQELIGRIIPAFDVVVINYRVGVAEKLGIDYATLSRLNPGLVYANITGFGDTGRYARRAGSDIVAQAYSGLMAAEAKTDEFGAPAPINSTTVIDRAAGLAAATGICAALYHRSRTGEGQQLSVSLLQTGLELLSHQVMREPVHDATLRDPLLGRLRNGARPARATTDRGVAEVAGDALRFSPNLLRGVPHPGGSARPRGANKAKPRRNSRDRGR
ncbi:MAG: CoA transferase [Dehalococcoidia bacterium]|nr:CoA transferase [Dehalococcoidia bacterium]